MNKFWDCQICLEIDMSGTNEPDDIFVIILNIFLIDIKLFILILKYIFFFVLVSIS